ncbi:CAP domain-containing protein [Streptomyces sp. TRM 70361]|uniref:CAP domain-containing protein n=1 Tax=Streptomyces sp. TRM 70361 TaxID=3116553 RepID=UPI002E7C4215|nr:CAP domain-containing protein [Streptomyces sp. TRM 70361]MEE1941867.1 CAP domain-containing protein [Streptomyces sp. TRM 70361]
MGRHRRANPAPAPAPVPAARGGRHRGPQRKRSAAPVRTGLLGASAAMAMGAVAVASGLIPGPNGTYTVGGPGSSSDIRTGGLPDLQTQGASTPPAADPAGAESPSSPGRTGDRSPAPGSGSPSSPGSGKPEKTPSDKPSESQSAPESAPPRADAPPSAGGNDASRTPPSRSPETPQKPPAEETGDTVPSSPSSSAAATAEAEVLKLVNLERAKAGCRPVTADPELAELAGEFSEDMAVQGFFSHTSPNGDTPWDRAEAAGIDNLGGENIARGQTDAEAVVEAWMNSPGHRANILNCDYRTLGVGAHFAEGGPWWTQNFGF